MRFHTETFDLVTKDKQEVVDITERVRAACRRSGISDGLCLVFPHHTSSAVYISDSDRNLTGDLLDVLERAAPDGAGYAHDRVDPKRNAAGHLRAVLTGHHIVLPVTGGDLDLGTYQTIYYAEFDGTRPKAVVVKVLGE